MPVPIPVRPVSRRLATVVASLVVLVMAIDRALAIPLPGEATAEPVGLPPPHLVVSEVMTGGASASDEFIELYNPTDAALPVEGLEVVYVTASGATITQKGAWATGALSVPSGGHLLIANDAGIFAPLADVQYANGMAAGGGSVALRTQSDTTAIDAVGWGTAVSTWLETRPAPAPPAGNSLERLPGGSSGSTQDSDDNLVDFVVQPVPDPQNSSSPLVPPDASPMPTTSATLGESPSAAPTATQSESPGATPVETPAPTATLMSTATPAPTPTPTAAAQPTPTPAPAPIPIATARSLADGTIVTVEGVTLTASDFAEGGGYMADASGAIAVLVSDGSFPRGVVLRVTGTVDDRFAQRTIRSGATDIVVGGPAAEPPPTDIASGEVGDAFEGALVQLSGTIDGEPTTLSGGIAFDLDDGSGATRVVVGSLTGIDMSAWTRDSELSVIGVVGQRDSSGTGTAGYRVQPRDPNDVVGLEPPAAPTPTPAPAATPTPTELSTATPGALASATPSATPAGGGLVTIAEGRAAKVGARVRIRGVVTAPSDLVEAGSAVIQDSTGAILVRLGSGAGSLALGQLVELDGTRSTKAGMLSLRITTPAVRLGTQADPEPMRRGTGALGEEQEARIVIVRGAVSGTVSRPRGGAVTFSLDDGSGQIRVSIAPRARIATTVVVRGAWLEIRGVLGQQTTGREPLRNYRLWPRTAADMRVIAAPVAGSGGVPCCTPVGQGTNDTPPGALEGPGGNGAPASTRPGLAPGLGRPQPTQPAAPDPPTAEGDPNALTQLPTQAAGLVVSAMGLAALAALAAWFGRRARRGASGGDADPERLHVQEDVAGSLEERRILPPI